MVPLTRQQALLADMLGDTLRLHGELRTIERRMHDLRDELATQAQSIREQADTFARVLASLDQHGRERYTEMVATQTRTVMTQVLAEIRAAGDQERATLSQIARTAAAAVPPDHPAPSARPAAPAPRRSSAPTAGHSWLRSPWSAVAALGLLSLGVVVWVLRAVP